MRPRADGALSCSEIRSPTSPSVISDGNTPGASALTRIPLCRLSCDASSRVRPSSPALDATYPAIGRSQGCSPSTLETLTMELPVVIRRAAACAIQYEPSRFTSMMDLKSSGASRWPARHPTTPALLTRTSTRPNARHAASASRSQSSGLVTSVSTATARRPCRSTLHASPRDDPLRRAPTTTSAPASASAAANATPRPEDAPVTMATRPSSRNRSRSELTPRRSLRAIRPSERSSAGPGARR